MMNPATPVSASLPRGARVAVVGAGISGLTYAYFLRRLRPDVAVTVFESGARTGGWIHSYKWQQGGARAGFPVMVEKGPRTLRGVSDGTAIIVDLVRQLGGGRTVQYIPAASDANKKFLLDPAGALLRVPESLWSADTWRLLTNPLGKGLLRSVAAEPWRRAAPAAGDESVGQFLRRRFGEHSPLGRNLLSAVYHGIYADDLEHVSLEHTSRRLMQLERSHGSVLRGLLAGFRGSRGNPTPQSSDLALYQRHFASDASDVFALHAQLKQYPIVGFSGGLQTVTNLLTDHLERSGVTFHRNSPVTSLGLPASGRIRVNGCDADHVRVTANPTRLRELLPPALTPLFQDCSAVSTVIVNFYHPTMDLIPPAHRGFGYLVPTGVVNHAQLLGVIFDSVVEQNFVPLQDARQHDHPPHTQYTKLTLMLGGHYLPADTTPANLDSDRWIETAKRCLTAHLGLTQSDVDAGHWQVTLAHRGLPRFRPGYPAWARSAQAAVAHHYGGHVTIGGLAFAKGPGLPDVVTDSLQTAINQTATHLGSNNS